MTTVPTVLEMRSITKTFPGVTALADVNLIVREGEIHAICGENGSRQVHPHEGAERRSPARQLLGRDRLPRRADAVP